jgi:hypothetical protein
VAGHTLPALLAGDVVSQRGGSATGAAIVLAILGAALLIGAALAIWDGLR